MTKTVLLILSPAFLFFVYDILFYLTWIPFGSYSELTVNLVSIFFVVNVFLLIFTYAKIKSIPDMLLEQGKQFKRGVSPFVFLVLIGIGLYSIFMQVGGNLTLNLEEKYSEVYSGGIFYIVIAQVVTYLLIYDIYAGRPRAFFTLIVVLYVFASAVTGGRSGVVGLILLILFISSQKFKISFAKFSFVMLVLAAFFVAGSVLRGTSDISRGGVIIGFLDFNQIFTLEETLKYHERKGSQFKLFLGDVIDGFVPRAINPEKNTSTAFTREVFPDVWSRTSYTSGFYANLLFVFGCVGLFLGPLIQTTLTLIYIRTIRQVQNGPVKFIWIYFLVFPLMIVRGGIFEFRVVFALFLVGVAVFLHKILQKKVVLVRRSERKKLV